MQSEPSSHDVSEQGAVHSPEKTENPKNADIPMTLLEIWSKTHRCVKGMANVVGFAADERLGKVVVALSKLGYREGLIAEIRQSVFEKTGLSVDDLFIFEDVPPPPFHVIDKHQHLVISPEQQMSILLGDAEAEEDEDIKIDHDILPLSSQPQEAA